MAAGLGDESDRRLKAAIYRGDCVVALPRGTAVPRVERAVLWGEASCPEVQNLPLVSGGAS